MTARRRWALVALAGALAGAGLGAILEVALDASVERGSEAYEEGYRVGFVLRYAFLGLVAFVLTAGLVVAGRSKVGVLVRVTGLLVVLALGIISALAVGDSEERTTGNFRAGFVDGCTERTAAEGYTRAEAAGYCECLIDSLTRELSRAELERLFRDARRAAAGRGALPPLFARAAVSCDPRGAGQTP